MTRARLLFRSSRGTVAARDERGSAMVEFAIIAPLLFVLIFGIVDFGRALFLMNNLASAVREGARLAAVQQDPGTSASRAAVQARVVTYIQNFGGTAPTTQPTVTLNQVAGEPYSITVTLSNYPFQAITPVAPLIALISPTKTPMDAIEMPTITAVFRWEGALN